MQRAGLVRVLSLQTCLHKLPSIRGRAQVQAPAKEDLDKSPGRVPLTHPRVPLLHSYSAGIKTYSCERREFLEVFFQNSQNLVKVLAEQLDLEDN